MEASIQSANTPALAQAATMQFSQQFQGDISFTNALSILKPQPQTKRANEWMTRASEFYKRAAQIKKAQLEAGDTGDSTGEVARYLKCGYQSYENWRALLLLLSKSAPKK